MPKDSGSGNFHAQHLVRPVLFILLVLIVIFLALLSPGMIPLRPIDPSLLIGKLLDLIFQLIAVVFGFHLLNVFWSRHEEQRKALPFDQIFQIEIELMAKFIAESVELFDRVYPPGESIQVVQRDQEVEQRIIRIITISKVLADIVGKTQNTSYRTARGYGFFLTYCKPDIEQIEHLHPQLRANATPVKGIFNKLSMNVNNLMIYLNGEKMTLSQLGDQVQRARHDATQVKREWDFSGLESYLFPDFKEDDHNQTFHYISRSDTEPRNLLGEYLGYGQNELELGVYEEKFTKLLINSKESIYCVYGHMGSGKSCTIRHIISVLRDGKCFACGVKGDCPHRKYIIIDFNNLEYPADENRARARLARDIFERLRLALKDSHAISEKEEMGTFWSYSLSALSATNYKSRVFSQLKEILDEKYSDISDDISGLQHLGLEDCKRIRSLLLREPEDGLEYYFHLWRYVCREKFQERSERLIVFFDNVDKSDPAVQTAFVQLLLKYAPVPGVKCVIAVRPETFEAMNLNRASGLMERLRQEGPLPFQVIKFHLRRFLSQPNLYSTRTPIPQEYDLLRKYLTRIIELEQEPHSAQAMALAHFFEWVCGPSIRLGIKLADGLLLLNEELISNLESDTLRLNHVIRSLIRRGNPRFSSGAVNKHYQPLENMFEVHGCDEPGRLLVKSRILKYIQSYGEGGVALRELRETLSRFGFSETELVRQAVNDLLNSQRQLIRSSDRDGFHTPEEFQGSGASTISITEIGKGYLQLICWIDYVEEIMIDCRVPTADYPPIVNISPTCETLIMAARFLKTIFEEDKREVTNFLQYGHNDYMEYVSKFGVVPISWEILTGVYVSARRIISSELKKPSLSEQTRSSYEDALGRFDGLIKDGSEFARDVLSIKLELPKEFESKP